MNVPKWVQEVFTVEDNHFILEDFLKNKECKFYKDKTLDDIWYLVVIEGADNDIECFTETDIQPLIKTFYRTATKEDWDEMKEKFGDEYKNPRYVAYEQLSIYYYELFARQLKKWI